MRKNSSHDAISYLQGSPQFGSLSSSSSLPSEKPFGSSEMFDTHQLLRSWSTNDSAQKNIWSIAMVITTTALALDHSRSIPYRFTRNPYDISVCNGDTDGNNRDPQHPKSQ
ncbi:MAG: hypothetical protein WD625_06100 [Balneolales bacterium]